MTKINHVQTKVIIASNYTSDDMYYDVIESLIRDGYTEVYVDKRYLGDEYTVLAKVKMADDIQ